MQTSSARIFGNIMQSNVVIISYLVTRIEFLVRLRTQTMLCGDVVRHFQTSHNIVLVLRLVFDSVVPHHHT